MTEAMKLLAVNYEEAGKLLGVCTRVVWQLVKDGKLRASRIGRSVRIPVTELERFLASRSGQLRHFKGRVMASLNYDKGTRKALIQWRDGSRRRRSIRLHNVAKTFAHRFVSIVERLDEASRTGGSIDNHTSDAVNQLADVFYAKLVKVDLVKPRVAEEFASTQSQTATELYDAFIAARVDIEESTRTGYRVARKDVARFFSDKPIDAISEGNAEDFARWLKGTRGLADCTVYRRVTRCRTVFDWA